FFAKLYEVDAPAKRAAEMVARVALSDEAARRPARTYSRGMLQRLAVARALIHQPRLLLADDPFTRLDNSGLPLLGTLLAEERARGSMLLVVTHDFDAVAGLCDRAVVLHRGRVAADEKRGFDGAGLAELYRRATV